MSNTELPPGADLRPVSRESHKGLRWTRDELDAAIFAAEMDVMQRDRRLERHVLLFGESLRERTRQSVRAGAVAAGVGAIGYLGWAWWRRRARTRQTGSAHAPVADRQRRAPRARTVEDDRSDDFEPVKALMVPAVIAGLVELLPMVWPHAPARWRERVSPQTVTTLSSWALPVLGLLRKRRRR